MAGYNRAHKFVESLTMCASAAATLTIATRFATSGKVFLPGEIASSTASAATAIFLGILSADFVSGFFHWMFDTWGDIDLPLLGAWAIHPFREHHVDPKAITTHDFVHTNGSNFLLAIFVSGPAVFWANAKVSPFTSLYLAVFTGFVCFTSQIHKWAHSDTVRGYVRVLRFFRLAIAVDHHAVHHARPHDRHYCITTGWLNRPLRVLRFFQTLEICVTWLTGAQPQRPESDAESPDLAEV